MGIPRRIAPCVFLETAIPNVSLAMIRGDVEERYADRRFAAWLAHEPPYSTQGFCSPTLNQASQLVPAQFVIVVVPILARLHKIDIHIERAEHIRQPGAKGMPLTAVLFGPPAMIPGLRASFCFITSIWVLPSLGAYKSEQSRT